MWFVAKPFTEILFRRSISDSGYFFRYQARPRDGEFAPESGRFGVGTRRRARAGFDSVGRRAAIFSVNGEQRRSYRQVRDHLDVFWRDGGEHAVLNIARPIRDWRCSDTITEEASATFGTAEPLPLPDKPAIAVLSFDNMSGDPEQGYFADGIAGDIITGLSR